MDSKKIWQQLNQDSSEALRLDLFFSDIEFKEELNLILVDTLGEPEAILANNKAIITWLRYSEVYFPYETIGPVLQALKIFLSRDHLQDKTSSSILNAFSCFLQKVTDPSHNDLIQNEWLNSDDPSWKEELLPYLAKSHSDHPEVIKCFLSAWEEDIVTASSYLFDYAHPDLLKKAHFSLQYLAPFQKYIWAKASYSGPDQMNWMEITNSWAKAKFPFEFKSFNFSLNSVEVLYAWVLSKESSLKASMPENQEKNSWENWRTLQADKYYLTHLPQDWREWFYGHGVTSSTREAFKSELQKILT